MKENTSQRVKHCDLIERAQRRVADWQRVGESDFVRCNLCNELEEVSKDSEKLQKRHVDKPEPPVTKHAVRVAGGGEGKGDRARRGDSLTPSSRLSLQLLVPEVLSEGGEERGE